LVVITDVFAKNPAGSLKLSINESDGFVLPNGLIWSLDELLSNDSMEISFTVKVSDFPVLQKQDRPLSNLLFYANVFYCEKEEFEDTCKPWENAWSIGEHSYKTQSNWHSLEPMKPNSPPQLSILSPLEGEVVEGLQKIIANVEDPDGVARIDVYLDGRSLGSITEAPYEFPLQYNALSIGEHTIKMDAWDKYGSLAKAAVTITATSPDETAPVINIDSPVEGASYCNSVEVEYQVIDQFGINSCYIHFAGKIKKAGQCQGLELSGITPLFDTYAHFNFDNPEQQVMSQGGDMIGEMIYVDQIESPFLQAISFINSDSQVNFENVNFNIENDLTVSFWLNPNRDEGVIFSQGWSYIGVEYGWAISLGANNHENNNPMSITWSSGDNITNLNQLNVVQSDTNTLVFGKWQHVVIRKKDKLVEIFYNGELVTSKSLSSGLIAWPYNIEKKLNFSMPMNHPTMYNRNYQGGLDEVSFWNRTLSNTEISNLYNRVILTDTQSLTIEAIDNANNTSKETKSFTFSDCIK